MFHAVHAKDWSQSLLGPVCSWPPSIRTAVSISLNSHFQMAVLCGPELVYIYNDATIPIFGDKHPWALGRRVAEVWPEAWPTIGPMLTAVLASGQATRRDDLLLVLERSGFAEECYFTFSYSPIPSEDQHTGGVFVTTIETSERVLCERRQRTLSDLGAQLALRRGDQPPLERVRQVLSDNPYDVPLAALYLAGPGGEFADLVFCTGLLDGSRPLARRIALQAGAAASSHPVARSAATFAPQLFPARLLLGETGRCGIWPEQPRQMLALPFSLPGQNAPRGVLVAAANPRASLDPTYRRFFDNLAGHVANAVAGAEAIAAERRRTAAIVTKTMAAEELVKAIRAAMAGGIQFDTGLADLLGPQASVPDDAFCGSLTVRETQIAALIGAGKQIKQIAAELEISISSVNTYRSRIFRKTGLGSNAALIRYALEHGLVK
jgi:DNA-binding CsgD family transcriptional regulator